LAAEWNPAIEETLAHTARWAQDEEEHWQAQLDSVAPGLLDFRDGIVLVEVPRLRSQPSAMGRRLIRRAIEMVKGDLRGIDFQHVEAILALAASCEGHGRSQAPGIDAMRSFEWLRLGSPEANRCENRDYSVQLKAPGVVPAPLAGTAICLEIVENSETNAKNEYVYNGRVSCLDGALANALLQVRNWRPGDRYQPMGECGIQTIKSLFQQARIPLWERRHWPVITAGAEIVWSRRFGPAVSRVAGPGAATVLRIREIPAGSGIELGGGGV
jgi:tRNA(Ile)-lysidine synthase